MSKLSCHCGYDISDTIAPSKTEGRLYTDSDQDIYEIKYENVFTEFLTKENDEDKMGWIIDYFGNEHPKGFKNK